MFTYTIGIDEAGRGPLAGPIVAAAVLFEGKTKQKDILTQAEDSKKLSNLQRESLFKLISENFLWSVQMLDSQFIDKYGIQKANFLVVWDALEEIKNKLNKPFEVMIDYIGGASTYINQPNINFYKNGEAKFKEIAAASIIAKVFRDRLMLEMDKEFPQYRFCLHKGYGTKLHYSQLDKFGLCPIHRRSFLRNY